jgi:hypothetical protein
MGLPLSLLESAQVLGRMRYVELAAFERLGHRAHATTIAPLATFLSGASLAHGWRACLLEDHLPVSAGLPGAAELTVSPSAGIDAALGLLGPASWEVQGGPSEPPPGDAELLAALTDVLYPAMLAGYERRLALASPACDLALSRTLSRIISDLATVLEDGRRLREDERLVATPDGAGHRSPLSSSLASHLGADGPFGPIGKRR